MVLGKFVKPEPISLQELVELKVLCCCHDIVQDHACMALNPELFSAETGGHGHCCGMMPASLCCRTSCRGDNHGSGCGAPADWARDPSAVARTVATRKSA